MDLKTVCFFFLAITIISCANASYPDNADSPNLDVNTDAEVRPDTANVRIKRQFYPGYGGAGSSASAFSSATAGGYGGFPGGFGNSFAGAQASSFSNGGGGFLGRKKK